MSLKENVSSESEESQEPMQSFPQVPIPKSKKQLRVSVTNNLGNQNNSRSVSISNILYIK